MRAPNFLLQNDTWVSQAPPCLNKRLHRPQLAHCRCRTYCLRLHAQQQTTLTSCATLLPAGHEQVKVVEQQHLEVSRDEAGGMRSMTMTSNPSLFVPGMGNTPIGDVVFHVYSTDDDKSCKVLPRRSLHPMFSPDSCCPSGWNGRVGADRPACAATLAWVDALEVAAFYEGTHDTRA